MGSQFEVEKAFKMSLWGSLSCYKMDGFLIDTTESHLHPLVQQTLVYFLLASQQLASPVFKLLPVCRHVVVNISCVLTPPD